jgi:hypothetical protein
VLIFALGTASIDARSKGMSVELALNMLQDPAKHERSNFNFLLTRTIKDV